MFFRKKMPHACEYTKIGVLVTSKRTYRTMEKKCHARDSRSKSALAKSPKTAARPKARTGSGWVLFCVD